MKSNKCLVYGVLSMFFLTGAAQGAVVYFWGNASGDWASTTTWDGGAVPSPTSVNQDIAITIGGVKIDVTTDGQGAIDMMHGYHVGINYLNIAAGKHLQIAHNAQIGCGNDIESDATGILNVYGSFYSDQLNIGCNKFTTGIVNVYDGGVINVGPVGCIIGKVGANGTGLVNLKGGIMIVSGGFTINPKGRLDVEKGTLKVFGDLRTKLQGYINDSLITSFGGIHIRCVPQVSYEDGWTYVKTTGGCICENYPAGDLNYDCYIDLSDLTLLAQGWLQCSSLNDPECTRVKLEMADTTLRLSHLGQSLDVSLNCPKFTLNIATTSESIAPVSIDGDITSGEVVTVSYNRIGLSGLTSMDTQLLLQWSPEEKVLRKWVRYKFVYTEPGLVLREIILGSIDRNSLLDEPIIAMPQSYPGFTDGFFMGIEFPIASTRIEGQKFVLGHRPGLRPQAGIWYESRKAVYGTAVPGRERNGFKDYISLHRPQPTGLHINYCSWWTSPYPKYTEGDILGLMQQFKDNLTTPYGVSIDTFTIDDGWAEQESIWEIKTSTFPNGFTNIQNFAQTMGTSVGLWSSPSCFYGNSLDTTWAMEQGYETYVLDYTTPPMRLCCIAGPLYNNAYSGQLVNYANAYGIKQYKIDGFNLNCPETNHGHGPDEFSAEALGQGGINVFQAIHNASPDAWLEATCFGWNPSPWWLFYVNSVTSPYGDDSPTGRVPCPFYRESYTTARDFYNLQGAALLAIPANAMEILGIVHQTTEPFLNDGVMTVMRGHGFLPLYINPAYMNSGRWSDLAQLLTWARNNSGTILANTYSLLPASWKNGKVPRFTHVGVMPREVYGYVHSVDNHGLIVLRNPWLAPQTYTLKLDESVGFDSLASGLSAVSLYPENRIYGQNLHYGSSLTFTMAPYETVVLTVDSGYNISGIATVDSVIGGKIQTDVTQSSAATNLTVSLQATVDTSAPQTKLLVVMEGTAALANPTYQQFLINGVPANVQVISSENGWNSTGLAEREHWKFLQIDLPSSHSSISLQQLVPDASCTDVSIWVWATKSGSGTPSFLNSLPSPEFINLDAALLGEFHR